MHTKPYAISHLAKIHVSSKTFCRLIVWEYMSRFSEEKHFRDRLIYCWTQTIHKVLQTSLKHR